MAVNPESLKMAASDYLDELKSVIAETPDYTDLIERLSTGTFIDCSCGDTTDIGKESAAALKAQAREIVDLQAELQVPLYVNDQLCARIAELEAALKPFADLDAPTYFQDTSMVVFALKVDDIRAARAAYLGEKE